MPLSSFIRADLSSGHRPLLVIRLRMRKCNFVNRRLLQLIQLLYNGQQPVGFPSHKYSDHLLQVNARACVPAHTDQIPYYQRPPSMQCRHPSLGIDHISLQHTSMHALHVLHTVQLEFQIPTWCLLYIFVGVCRQCRHLTELDTTGRLADGSIWQSTVVKRKG